MSAQPAPALRSVPPVAHGTVLVEEDAVLTIETVSDGTLIDRANDALAQAIREAVKHKAKATVTLKVSIAPGGKDMEDAMKVTSSVSLALPKIESAKIHLPTPDGRITTDLKSVRKVLRRIAGGSFEDVRTGEVVDVNGVSTPETT